MSFEKTYLTAHSPSCVAPNFSSNPSTLAYTMNPPLIPIGGYPGAPILMATLAPRPTLPMATTIDMSNPPPRRTGVCKFFNVGKGFGFIQDLNPEELPTLKGDPGTDVFAHYSCIVSCDAPYKSLLDGETVEYYLGRSNKGLAALEITGPGGANVKGCINSRSPTVLQPMPRPADALKQGGGAPLVKNITESPKTSAYPSSAYDNSIFHTSQIWSIAPTHKANSTLRIGNSSTFPLAVGVPLHVKQHIRGETAEGLAVSSCGGSLQMRRMSSTPVLAPRFGSSHLKEFKESRTLNNLGVGIGIGVHWEPKTRAHTAQWSPPGKFRTGLKETHNSHGNGKTSDTSVDRTMSNWRFTDVKTRVASPTLISPCASPDF